MKPGDSQPAQSPPVGGIQQRAASLSGSLREVLGLSLVLAVIFSAGGMINYFGFKSGAFLIGVGGMAFWALTAKQNLASAPGLRFGGWYLLAGWMALNTLVDIWYLSSGLSTIEVIGLVITWTPVPLFFIALPLVFGTRFIHPTLITVALGCAWFAWFNLLADAAGLRDARVDAREFLYESWYVEGTYRWQSPLISAGPLSGLLRFAVPVLLYFGWHAFKLRNWVPMSVHLIALAGASIALIRTEYRNGFIPFAGLLIWFSLGSDRTRRNLIMAFIGYALLAPVLWTNQSFILTLEQAVPDSVLRALGRQDLGQITSLSGRVDIWTDGIEQLLHGTHFLVGCGQAALNSADYSASADFLLSGYDATIVPRIDFHHGLLDLMFIYGVVPVVLFLLLLGVALLKGCRVRLHHGEAFYADSNFAILAMGMIWLSNAHDGYFSGTNFFCGVIGICLMQLLRSAPIRFSVPAARPASSVRSGALPVGVGPAT